MRSAFAAFVVTFTLSAAAPIVSAEDAQQILAAWSKYRAAHPSEGFHGTARVIQYDTVFEVESRYRVEFWMRDVRHWRLDMAPVDIAGQISHKKGHDNATYTLKTETHERMAVVGELDLHQWGNQSRIEIENRRDAPKVLNGWLGDQLKLIWWPDDLSEPCFAFGWLWNSYRGFATEAEAREGKPFAMPNAWLIEPGAMHGRGPQNYVHLVCHPKTPAIAAGTSRLEFLLRPNIFEPLAVRRFDPAGSKETVWVFEDSEELDSDDPFTGAALAEWPPRCLFRAEQ